MIANAATTDADFSSSVSGQSEIAVTDHRCNGQIERRGAIIVLAFWPSFGCFREVLRWNSGKLPPDFLAVPHIQKLGKFAVDFSVDRHIATFTSFFSVFVINTVPHVRGPIQRLLYITLHYNPFPFPTSSMLTASRSWRLRAPCSEISATPTQARLTSVPQFSHQSYAPVQTLSKHLFYRDMFFVSPHVKHVLHYLV